MTYQRPLFASLFVAVFSIVAASQNAAAGDYVWARTNWGSSNISRPYSSMSNGYGGYYVPRNAYGNNFESSGGFTNPNGFIVPAQTTSVQQYGQATQGPRLFGHRRHARRY